MFQIQNNSAEDVNPIIDILNQFIPFSQKKLGFNKPVSLFLQSDEENANKILGKTAFYNPTELSVTVFTSGRHPKDILRSLSHELVHHAQNCRGDFEGNHIAGEGYAQKDPHMRNMELEAYEKGNIIFRDFEDLIKADEININLSGESQMSLKEWRDNELNTLLMEKWGYSSKEKLEELTPSDGPRSKEQEDEEGNRPSMAKDMDLNEADEEETKVSSDLPAEVQAALDASSGKAIQRTDADAAGLRPGGGGDAAASVGELPKIGGGKGGTLPPKEKVKLNPPPANEDLTISEAKEIARRIFMKLSEQDLAKAPAHRQADRPIVTQGDAEDALHRRQAEKELGVPRGSSGKYHKGVLDYDPKDLSDLEQRARSRRGDSPGPATAGAMREGCPDLEDDEMEIDISKPEMGMEVHVQDLSDLTPDEAFGAGWAAAAQAIEDALSNAPHEAEEAGEDLEEGLLDWIIGKKYHGGRFSDSPGRNTDSSTFKKKVKQKSKTGQALEDAGISEQYSAEQALGGGMDGSATTSGEYPETENERAQVAGSSLVRDAMARAKAKREQEKMAPGQTGAAATPGTEPADLFIKESKRKRRR